MSLVKDFAPILEHDSEKKALFTPNLEGYVFPKKGALLFLADEVERYALARGAEKLGEFVTVTKTHTVWGLNYRGTDVCFCRAPMGAPAATVIMEFMISAGCEEIFATGTCGALENFAENEFIVPTEALRDEGTSYHYLPCSRTVLLDPAAVEAAVKALEKRGIPYKYAKVWTTDGFYRETADMIKYRKSEGCAVVDMECAALAACAQFRGVKFGQILFTADSLANLEKYDARGWGQESFSVAAELALDALCLI
jgi:uridine phosphorylase